MKRIIALILLVFCIAGLFTACSKEEESTLEIKDIENVTISLKGLSATGATVIIKDTNAEPFTYGEWYKIERLKKGKWYSVKTVIDDYAFNEIGYIIDELSETRELVLDINWRWLYGILEKGDYRLIKEVERNYIAVEFSIE